MVAVQTDGNLHLLRQLLHHGGIAGKAGGALNGDVLREEHDNGRRVGGFRGVDHGSGHHIIHADKANGSGVALLGHFQNISNLFVHK